MIFAAILPMAYATSYTVFGFQFSVKKVTTINAYSYHLSRLKANLALTVHLSHGLLYWSAWYRPPGKIRSLIERVPENSARRDWTHLHGFDIIIGHDFWGFSLVRLLLCY
jgi:hypothetical protein